MKPPLTTCRVTSVPELCLGQPPPGCSGRRLIEAGHWSSHAWLRHGAFQCNTGRKQRAVHWEQLTFCSEPVQRLTIYFILHLIFACTSYRPMCSCRENLTDAQKPIPDKQLRKIILALQVQSHGVHHTTFCSRQKWFTF